MKTQTRLKLTSLANIVGVKYGKDVVNYSNYLTILKNENESSGLNLHIVTIKKYLSFIGLVISQLRDNFLDFNEPVKVVEPNEPVKLLKIKMMYSDGSYEYFVPETKNEEKVPEPVIDVFTGLFNYNPNGSIVIRRGKYGACDITSKSSVLTYFKSISWYKTWCEARINDAKQPTFISSKDTPRDVETLTAIINKLNERDRLF
jgi:hypothetical protein